MSAGKKRMGGEFGGSASVEVWEGKKKGRVGRGKERGAECGVGREEKGGVVWGSEFGGEVGCACGVV